MYFPGLISKIENFLHSRIIVLGMIMIINLPCKCIKPDPFFLYSIIACIRVSGATNPLQVHRKRGKSDDQKKSEIYKQNA